MPIPQLPKTGEITREQIIELYAQEPYAWKRVLEFDWVEINQANGAIYKIEYRFDADAIPCSERGCVTYRLTFIQLRPQGVYKTCAICRRTEGPITRILGVQKEKVPITAQEAWAILAENGQTPPKGLNPISTGGSLRIVR